MKQLSLLPNQDEQVLRISILNYGNYYQAEMLGGWYMARGKSKKEAIKRVLKIYEMENE